MQSKFSKQVNQNLTFRNSKKSKFGNATIQSDRQNNICLHFSYITGLTELQYEEDDLPGNASYLIDEGFKTSVNSSWTVSTTSTWLYQVPWGLTKMLQYINDNYNRPEIIITENGWSENGASLSDPDRIEYFSVSKMPCCQTELSISVCFSSIYRVFWMPYTIMESTSPGIRTGAFQITLSGRMDTRKY